MCSDFVSQTTRFRYVTPIVNDSIFILTHSADQYYKCRQEKITIHSYEAWSNYNRGVNLVRNLVTSFVFTLNDVSKSLYRYQALRTEKCFWFFHLLWNNALFGARMVHLRFLTVYIKLIPLLRGDDGMERVLCKFNVRYVEADSFKFIVHEMLLKLYIKTFRQVIFCTYQYPA